MSAMASQITCVSIVCSDADQRKHQSAASLAFVTGNHRWLVNSPHKGPVTRKMYPFDDVNMAHSKWPLRLFRICLHSRRRPAKDWKLWQLYVLNYIDYVTINMLVVTMHSCHNSIGETNKGYGYTWFVFTMGHLTNISQITKFMGPTWCPTGSCQPQMGLMLAPWTLLWGMYLWPE